nr:hypothetical protein [uncultured Prevotella sp.]
MRKILRLFPMMLLCLCVLTACSSDDGDNNGDSNCKNGVYVINGHKFVDLGLPSGLLWAECNIGASEPEEAGYSYRWGEVEPINYDIEYKFKDGNTYTKYTKKDAKTTLEPEDDAATVLWGKNCRMPTKKEFEELVKNCKWKFADEYGDATVTGPNGNHIFLPKRPFSIMYRTSSFDTTYPTDECVYSLQLYRENTVVVAHTSRTTGMSIRPVAEK